MHSTDRQRIDAYGQSFAVLKDNTFGILDSGGTDAERAARLLALIPMFFEFEGEARDTIKNLREELLQYREEKLIA